MMDIQEMEDAISELHGNISELGKLLKDSTLDGGVAGLSLYYFYYYSYTKNSENLELAEYYLEQCIAIVSELANDGEFTRSFKTDSLANHIAGLGKVLLFIQYKFDFGYDFSDYYEIIAAYLEPLVKCNLKEGDFDIHSGALAAGYFFLNYYHYTNDDFARQILLTIYQGINKFKQYNTENEIYWKSISLDNRVYVGISHGSAMVLNFINKLLNNQVLDLYSGNVREVLNKGFHFIWNRKRAFKTGLFPALFPDEGHVTTQFSMTYGDLGVLYVLSQLHKKLELGDEIDHRVMEMLDIVTTRKNDKSYTRDASILYGAAGVAILFKNLFLLTNNANFLESYTYWISEINTYRNSVTSNFGGFGSRFFNVAALDDPINLSFGWGIIGISITLMVAKKSTLPDFTELTLIGM